MKNMKAIVLLILAIITGLAAAVYAASWVSQRGNIASTKVVVATVDIELGSKISPQMLTTSEWPRESVPADAFRDIAQLQDRVVKSGVLRGEAIVDRKLAPVGTQGGLSAVIAEGKRAMTVRVNDVVGVAGFALPGNYVDVMVNAQQDRGNAHNNQVSMTVLEQVLVLAVAQEASRDETKPKVVSAVTLELSPGDAEKLDLARSVGTLSLVLRNQLDKKAVATSGVTKAELLGLKPAAVTNAPPSAQPVKVVA
jgi:pilus assembly protein CpaB